MLQETCFHKHIWMVASVVFDNLRGLFIWLVKAFFKDFQPRTQVFHGNSLRK